MCRIFFSARPNLCFSFCGCFTAILSPVVSSFGCAPRGDTEERLFFRGIVALLFFGPPFWWVIHPFGKSPPENFWAKILSQSSCQRDNTRPLCDLYSRITSGMTPDLPWGKSGTCTGPKPIWPSLCHGKLLQFLNSGGR